MRFVTILGATDDTLSHLIRFGCGAGSGLGWRPRWRGCLGGEDGQLGLLLVLLGGGRSVRW